MLCLHAIPDDYILRYLRRFNIVPELAPYNPSMSESIFAQCCPHRDTEQQIYNTLGALLMSSLFMGVLNAVFVQPVMVAERAVFYRERAAGMYSAEPWYLAIVRSLSIDFCLSLSVWGQLISISGPKSSLSSIWVFFVYHELSRRVVDAHARYLLHIVTATVSHGAFLWADQ